MKVNSEVLEELESSKYVVMTIYIFYLKNKHHIIKLDEKQTIFTIFLPYKKNHYFFEDEKVIRDQFP